MKYYLTDNIYIEKGKTYKELDKIIEIKKNNWHKYLNDYGWSKLSLGWKKRLKEPNNKNSCFGILECGSDGDCLFHVLCEALNSDDLINLRLPKYDIKKLRQIAANQINKTNFDIIIETYKLEYNDIDFNGQWNPFEIYNSNQLKEQICTLGNHFWGDHILLQLIQKKLNINIIILNSEDYSQINLENRFKIHPTASNDFENYNKTIIIYYSDNIHFQLIGYFDGKIMKTLFNKDEIPLIILDIYNKDCRNE